MTNHLQPIPEKDLMNMPLDILEKALQGMLTTIERKQAKHKECLDGLEALKAGMAPYVPDNEPKMVSVEVTHPLAIWEGMSLLELKKAMDTLSPEGLEGHTLQVTMDYDDFEGLYFARQENRLENREEIARRNQHESTRHYTREGYKIQYETERLQGVLSVLNRQIPQIGANIEALKAEITSRKAQA